MINQFGANKPKPDPKSEYKETIGKIRSRGTDHLQLIGQGSSSRCYALDQDNVVVVSLVGDDVTKRNHLNKSLEVLGNLDRLLSYEYSPEDKLYYIVQKRVKGQPLSNLFFEDAPKTADPLFCLNLAIQLVDKTEKIHKLGWMHGDLHVENIMVDAEGHVEVLDFDWSEKILGDSTKETPRKPDGEHHAPEWRKGGKASLAADTYSLGALLGKGALDGIFGLNLDKIESQPVLRDLIKTMVGDVDKRPSLDVVKTALQQAKQQLEPARPKM